MENKKQIKSFTDLIAWQEGHKLVLTIYKSTYNFPESELFGLTNQIRRCAVSITSNITEGFSNRTSKGKNQFFFMALGSVTELQNQLVIARDLKYVQKEEFQLLANQSVIVHKLINGLIKYNKNHKQV